MNRLKIPAISVKARIKSPIDIVWKNWTTPEDIVKWNNASDDWHTPWAENDLRAGGNFSFRMEAKDGSTGFDFAGVYEEVKKYKQIVYTIGDGRKVSIVFSALGNATDVVETFDAENTHPIELQRNGWQSILNNFKKYTENKTLMI